MENKQKTNRYQKSIDLLNDAIGKEIASSLQYMYFHVVFEDAGYQYLARALHQISIAEMRHIEDFSERIMYLQGDVNMNAAFQTRQIHDVKEALKMCMDLEASTIDLYNKASRISSEDDDAITHRMFQNVIGEEEQHHDWFRTELQNVINYGEKEYLALQSVAASKDRSKTAGHPGEKE